MFGLVGNGEELHVRVCGSTFRAPKVVCLIYYEEVDRVFRPRAGIFQIENLDPCLVMSPGQEASL